MIGLNYMTERHVRPGILFSRQSCRIMPGVVSIVVIMMVVEVVAMAAMHQHFMMIVIDVRMQHPEWSQRQAEARKQG